VHPLRDHRAHLIELGRRGIAIGKLHGGAADGIVTHEKRDVHPDA
jgi:hypothetical protein